MLAYSSHVDEAVVILGVHEQRHRLSHVQGNPREFKSFSPSNIFN